MMTCDFEERENIDAGFPLFWTEKIPWYFHDFSRFFSKFPGIFFIIFKVWFPSGFEYKYANFIEFHLNKKLIISIILQISKPSFLLQ